MMMGNSLIHPNPVSNVAAFGKKFSFDWVVAGQSLYWVHSVSVTLCRRREES